MHGAKESSQYYVDKYHSGEIPKSKNLKIRFLESTNIQRSSNGDFHPWMKVSSAGDIDEKTRHTQGDIEMNGDNVRDLIMWEINTYYGGDSSRVFLGGKS